MDSFTLLVCTLLISILMSLAMLALFFTSPRDTAIADWFAGIFAFCLCSCFAALSIYALPDTWLLPALANSFFVAGHALVLSGITRYVRKQPAYATVLGASVLAFILHLTPLAQAGIEYRILFMHPILLVLSLASVRLLWQKHQRHDAIGVLPLIAILSVHIFQLTLRAVALLLDQVGITLLSNDVIFESGSLFMVVYLIAMAMGFAFLITWEKEQALHRFSITDNLTGWLNRHGLQKTAPKLLQRCAEHSQPLAIVVLDVDYFKAINDTYGHTVGDNVLVHITQVARAVTREHEHCYRLGGEEFALVLADCDQSTALAVAERIRQAIAAQPYEDDNDTIRTSASFGIAVVQASQVNHWEQVLQQADQALYQAKADGRNRACVYAA